MKNSGRNFAERNQEKSQPYGLTFIKLCYRVICRILRSWPNVR
jgi:hypothetical protein